MLFFLVIKLKKYIPAKKGRDHVLYMVRELLSFQPHSGHTDIEKALTFLNNTTRHKSIVFFTEVILLMPVIKIFYALLLKGMMLLVFRFMIGAMNNCQKQA